MTRLEAGVDGTVVIGRSPAGPAGLVSLPLVGGMAVLDPVLPDELHVAVDGTDDGWETLVGLFGAEVAQRARVAAATAVGTGSGVVQEVATPATSTAVLLARLGVVRWLGVWSPVPVPAHVALAETADLVEQLTEVLSEEFVQQVLDELVEEADVLLDLADALGSSATSPDDRGLLGPVLAPAWQLLGDHLPADHPAYERAQYAASVGAAPADLLTEEVALALVDVVAAPARAAHAGVSAAAAPEGVTTVDWVRVRPGLTTTDEDNVRWQVEGRVLTVEVDGAVERQASWWPPVGELEVAAHDRTALGVELVRAHLTWDVDRAQYRARVDLPREVDGLVLDVRTVGRPGGPAQPAEQVLQAARRWSARAVALARWSRGDTSLLPVTWRGVDAATTALSLLVQGRGLALPPQRGAELADQELAVSQLLAALWTSAGEPDEAEDVLSGLTAEGTERPLEPLDTTSAGWRLTGTERVLLAAPRVLAPVDAR